MCAAPPLDLSSSPKATQAEFMLSPTSSPFLGPPCTSSALPSPLVAGPSSEIKQSWFSNLFSWKPAVRHSYPVQGIANRVQLTHMPGIHLDVSR